MLVRMMLMRMMVTSIQVRFPEGQRRQSSVYGGCRLGREWKNGGSDESGYDFLKRGDFNFEYKA